jgi:hypothetical protein
MTIQEYLGVAGGLTLEQYFDKFGEIEGVLRSIEQSIGNFTKEELCVRIGITPEVLDEIMSGRKNMLLVTNNGQALKNYIALLVEQTDEKQVVVLGGIDAEDYSTLSFSNYIYYDKALQKYDVQDI